MYSPQAANETYAYVKVGNIHYKVTKKIEGETITLTPTLGVERSLDSGTTLRDANGKYKNKAELISILAGVLSIPGGVASKVANKILEKIGLAADAVNFLIPTFNVKAAYTMATWHGIGSSKTKVVQGPYIPCIILTAVWTKRR